MTEVSTINVDEPMDLMKLSLNKTILVKCRYNHEIKGKLHVFDSHLNLLLSEVEETSIVEELDQYTQKTIKKKKARLIPMLYVRGDTIIFVGTDIKNKQEK